MIQLQEFVNVLPLVIISIAAIITLMIAVFFKKSTHAIMIISALSIISAIYFSFNNLNTDIFVFNELMKLNAYSAAFSVISLVSVLMSVLSAQSYIEKENINFGEFYSLALFSTIGMIVMITANDLLILFLGLELMSVCFYILAGFLRKRVKSNEAALKYFLLGAFMTGFLLFGISLIYGSAGTTNITKIVKDAAIIKQPVFLIGLGLFFTGFFFKIGVFPFHLWVPDVYEGAPTPITGLMSAAGKIAAAGTMTMIVNGIIGANLQNLKIIFSVIAVLSMLFGNVIALSQTNIKRLLAFSSIASAGYILVGIAAMNEFSIKGVAFYLMAYAFMQMGAFIVVSVVEAPADETNDFKNVSLENYTGLGRKNPMLASSFTFFLLSLGGIPPFAGFWGKYYLFYSAIKGNLIWLSVIAIVLSVVSIYYYLKIIVLMWFKTSDTEINLVEPSSGSTFAIYFAAVVSLLLGIYPQLFFTLFKILV